MNIVGDYPLYRKLMLLSLKENCTLVDYLHSKEIVYYEEDSDITDLTKARRKTINGVYVPSFEYVIGKPQARLSRTMVKNGKEYTFFLRNLMRQKMRTSDIINGENYSDDDKYNLSGLDFKKLKVICVINALPQENYRKVFLTKL